MNSLERIAQQLQRGERRDAIEKLTASPSGARLEKMIDGAALEKAVSRGDTAALQTMLQRLLSTPEGKALAADVQKIMEQ